MTPPPAEKKPSSKKTTPRAPRSVAPTLSFSRVNAMWLGAGVGAIALGYLLLASGTTTLAAVLLVLGYCVLLPVGIIKR